MATQKMNKHLKQAVIATTLALAFAMTSGATAASISFANFSDVTSLNLNGDAEVVSNSSGDTVIRLVDSNITGIAQSGTVFLNDKIF